MPTAASWPSARSRLYDTATGAEIAAPSFTGQARHAVAPAFSPDGKHLAFTWLTNEDRSYDQLMGMDVDLGTTPPTFGTMRVLATAETGVVAWPSYLPDGRGLIYGATDRFDTVIWGGGPSYGELRLVDTQTSQVSTLGALNGWLNGTSALPGGEAEDNWRNYEASVLPVPVGGYYWVMFTSRRTYGHTLAPGGTVAGTDDEWGRIVDGVEMASPRKKIWLAAIDLDYQGQLDPSHPAIYLPGQELAAGNMRAFAALEPCRALGQGCASGSDCCDGYCRPAGDDDALTCVLPPGDCSQIDEPCELDGDCCDVLEGVACIGGRCARENPIP
jgi:dipeptidyl aminopeptidase/acylaminoacyl peptidase